MLKGIIIGFLITCGLVGVLIGIWLVLKALFSIRLPM